ncbi:hypothetical protein Pfo_019152 [Paulownia fortunei]|nr:hypothetical protein Pfo_019152 [Paulownia fortunei]
MPNSLRALKAQPPSLFSSSLPNYITRKASGIRFAQAVSRFNQHNTSAKMDQKEEHKSKSGERKSSSGGGYARRSDEEGYGAEYGGNKSLSKDDEDKIVHGTAPEYDQSERSS